MFTSRDATFAAADSRVVKPRTAGAGGLAAAGGAPGGLQKPGLAAASSRRALGDITNARGGQPGLAGKISKPATGEPSAFGLASAGLQHQQPPLAAAAIAATSSAAFQPAPSDWVDVDAAPVQDMAVDSDYAQDIEEIDMDMKLEDEVRLAFAKALMPLVTLSG